MSIVFLSLPLFSRLRLWAAQTRPSRYACMSPCMLECMDCPNKTMHVLAVLTAVFVAFFEILVPRIAGIIVLVRRPINTVADNHSAFSEVLVDRVQFLITRKIPFAFFRSFCGIPRARIRRAVR